MFSSIQPEMLTVFKDVIKRSVETQKETAAVFCHDPGMNLVGHVVDGDEDKAELPECPSGSSYFADFHTHPKSRMLSPSAVDVVGNIQRSWWNNKPIRSCIGAPYMDNFYCFSPRKQFTEFDFMAAAAMKDEAFKRRNTPKWFGEMMTAEIFNEDGELVPKDEFRVSFTRPEPDQVACLPDTDDDERLTNIFTPYCTDIQYSLPDHDNLVEKCVVELKEQRKWCKRDEV